MSRQVETVVNVLLQGVLRVLTFISCIFAFSCSEVFWLICIYNSHFELTLQSKFYLGCILQDVCNSESELGRFPFSPFKPVLVHGDASDVRVQLRDLNNNWVARSSCKKVNALSWARYRFLVLWLIMKTLCAYSRVSRQVGTVMNVLILSRWADFVYRGSLTERQKMKTDNIH